MRGVRVSPAYNPAPRYPTEGRFVLKRNSDGKYVAKSGMLHSYTRDLAQARRFQSRAAASASACGNEQVFELSA